MRAHWQAINSSRCAQCPVLESERRCDPGSSILAALPRAPILTIGLPACGTVGALLCPERGGARDLPEGVGGIARHVCAHQPSVALHDHRRLSCPPALRPARLPLGSVVLVGRRLDGRALVPYARAQRGDGAGGAPLSH
eukprot:scaffold232477_cov33-Tisochrysis_lutea.AAC.2